jgi:hypothetical protein
LLRVDQLATRQTHTPAKAGGLLGKKTKSPENRAQEVRLQEKSSRSPSNPAKAPHACREREFLRISHILFSTVDQPSLADS